MNIEVFKRAKGYQFRMHSPQYIDTFEHIFEEYVKNYASANRKETRKRYQQLDPLLFAKRISDLCASFFYFVRDNSDESALVRYYKKSFWHVLLWSFESAIEYECRTTTDKVISFLEQKQSDYGNKVFSIYGDLGIATRVIDKSCRLENLLSKKEDPNFESIRDSYKDMFCYALLAIDYMEKRYAST